MEAETHTAKRLRVPLVGEEIVQCPSCDIKLRSFEMAKHCEQEMEQLRQTGRSITDTVAVAITENGRNTINDERRQPWTVFQKVQRNRQSRQKQRTRKRTAPPPTTEHICPVCNLNFPQEEIQQHADQCVRRTNGENGHEEHSSNEDDDGDEYEEYEWAGQKRIRASSLLQGGYASIGVGQATTNNRSGRNAEGDDEEEDLNVDEDDTQIYGPAQYDESDMIPTTADQSDSAEIEEIAVTSYMRRLITAGQKSTSNATMGAVNTEESSTLKPEETTHNHIPAEESCSSSRTKIKATQPQSVQHCLQIIESLKEKLGHYENHVPSKFKCLICLDDYRNPAISVSCWHVHCEECWLRSLGARKLCPQCNLITAPKDLRRIYM